MAFSTDQILSNAQIVELTEEHALAEQPPNLIIPLKRHQLTLLNKCLSVEQTPAQIDQRCRLKTRIGIIADKVGAGKSYVILGLVSTPSCQLPQKTITSSFAYDNVHIEHDDTTTYSNTNVIVIPHNLIKQWTSYCETVAPQLRKFLFVSSKSAAALYDATTSATTAYDLILVSSTFHNSFVQLCQNKSYTFRRVFYDEVDSIPIKSSDRLNAYFTWFVTASYKNVMYPRGYGAWSPTERRFVRTADGIRCTGYLRSLFQSMTPQLCKLLVIKNTDTYVDSTMNLPPINTNIIRCKLPRTIRILDGIVDDNIIRALNANDIETAISYIHPQQRSTEDNIITLILEKYNRVHQNATLMLRIATEDMVYDTPAAREAEITKYRKVKDDCEQKINSITERIRNSDTCNICFDTMCNKTITECCQNAYCFKCVNVWLSTRQTCPSCRKPMGTSNLFVVNPNHAIDGDDVVMTDPDNLKDKFENLQEILQAKPDGKFLIFSCYDTTFQKTEQLLHSLNQSFALLKGSHDVIASITRRYKSGDLNILLVNPRNYGSGLNLENTTDIVILHKFDTDIEHQVIGRAQRLGREHSLNVHYLLYENEITE